MQESPYKKHRAKWKDCQLCSLCEGRDKIVLARGQIPSDIVFIGEAPGESENILGSPFVGPAGIRLDQIITLALEGTGLRYSLTNLVACFPKEEKREGINEPPVEAIKACQPRLIEYIRLCTPQAIVLVGKLAAKHVRGQAMFCRREEEDHPFWIPTDRFMAFCEIVHPAAILRMPLIQQRFAINQSVARIRELASSVSRM